MAMMLTALGSAFVIVRARTGGVSLADYAMGYGSTVLGLHLYTWAAITFLVVLLFCGASLIVARELLPAGVHYGAISRITQWLLVGIVAANAVVVFFEEGFHWFLPDNPTRYQFFTDLGLGAE